MDTKDLEAIWDLKDKTPQTVGDVRQLLGFLSYYRTYVQDFLHLAKLLYDLLQTKSETPSLKQSQRKNQKSPAVFPSPSGMELWISAGS